MDLLLLVPTLESEVWCGENTSCVGLALFGVAERTSCVHADCCGLSP